MRVTGLDLETTGLDWDVEAANKTRKTPKEPDRVIEYCSITYKLPERKRLLVFEQRINPQGKKINPKAEAVHGISAGDLVGKPVFKSIAPKIQKILEATDLLVIHNAAFDAPFLAFEMDRAGFTMPADLLIYDTMTEGMWSSYDGKAPKLGELCWAAGVPYDRSKAHAASYDVEVMLQSFFKALDYGLVDTSDWPEDARLAA